MWFDQTIVVRQPQERAIARKHCVWCKLRINVNSPRYVNRDVLPHNETTPISKRDAITEILDEKTQSILRSVTSATCVLVDPDDFSRNARPISPCVDVSAADVRMFATLLLDHESWFFARKRCLPKSTAILTLSSPVERITILIGMSCADWEIQTAHRRIGGFFDPVADQIRGMLKRTFPDIASSNSQSLWRNGAIAKLRRIEAAEQSDPPKSSVSHDFES